MRTFSKHGLVVTGLAVVVAACSAACGEPQPQPARDPIAQNHPVRQEPVTDPQTYGPALADPKPQQAAIDTNAYGPAFGDPAPQKPFYGPGTTDPNDPKAGAKSPVGLSDGDIAAIETAANHGEMDEAQLALKNSNNKDVRAFAQMMVKQHGEAQAKADAIVKKDKIVVKDNDVSLHLKDEVASTIKSLRAGKGSDFDRAYVDSQVKAHQDVLDMIDNTLLPQVQNPELKAHIGEIRHHVAMHLTAAQDLQSKLSAK